MGKLVDTLFGDKGKGAAKQQAKQNEQERQFILQQTQQAQNLLQQMYPTMQQNTMLGGQQALDIARGALPQMANARQQGTQNAIAAILGGQARQIQPNFDFLPQNLPAYQLMQQQQQPQAQTPDTRQQILDAVMRKTLGKSQIMGGR